MSFKLCILRFIFWLDLVRIFPTNKYCHIGTSIFINRYAKYKINNMHFF